MTIGEKIRAVRKSRNMTQKELAEKSGVAEITIRNYENQKRQPRIEQLQNIAIGLGLRIEDFTGPEKNNGRIATLDLLESIGYKTVHYEEEEYSILSLKDTDTFESYTITFQDLDTLENSIMSYAKFQVQELINRLTYSKEGGDTNGDSEKEES